MLTQDQLKQLAAQAALAHIEPLFTKDAVIGVGTGSTADLFIDGLAAYKHLFKATVASSERSALRLQQHGIPVLDLNEVESLVVYVDGADEINESLAMIKGGGGALTREKIVASVAKKFVCIADESKLVEVLGAFPLPLEVIPMAQTAVMRSMESLGGRAVLREGFITDNGNIIVDVHNLRLTDPLAFELMASQLPGVVTCGIFAKQCAQVALLATQSGIRQLGQ